MLDFHWMKAMLFFRKYYDFLQFFLHHGIFQKYNGRWENTMIKNSSILHSDALGIYLQVMITTDIF